MDIDFSGVCDGLRDAGLLPDHALGVFVSGSLVRGWGNAGSDLDVCVVTQRPRPSSVEEYSYVALHPDQVGWEFTGAGGRRWEIEYWTDGQVDECFAKVSWESFESGTAAWKKLSLNEQSFLERVPYGVAVDDGAWLARRQQQLAGSAHRSAFVARSLDHMDGFVEDALGQWDNGDTDSAVLSARIAFGHAIDALLAAHGQFGTVWPKWRARRFRLADQSVVGTTEYWRYETMQDFDPENPKAWVDGVVLLCQRVADNVSL